MSVLGWIGAGICIIALVAIGTVFVLRALAMGEPKDDDDDGWGTGV